MLTKYKYNRLLSSQSLLLFTKNRHFYFLNEITSKKGGQGMQNKLYTSPLSVMSQQLPGRSAKLQ